MAEPPDREVVPVVDVFSDRFFHGHDLVDKAAVLVAEERSGVIGVRVDEELLLAVGQGLSDRRTKYPDLL